MEYPNEYKDLFKEVGDSLNIKNVEINTLDDSTAELLEFCQEISEDTEEVETIYFT